MKMKSVRFCAIALALMTLFACTPALAAEDGNGFFVSGFGQEESTSSIFSSGQQGGFSSFGSFSPSADRKTGVFLRNFSAAGILSYYRNLIVDDDPLKGTQNIIKDYKNYLVLEAMVEQVETNPSHSYCILQAGM